MLNVRKANILCAVVQEYIDTAQPVGSLRVSDSPGVDASPATVRSEMAALENESYLGQPHTSAGQSPHRQGLPLLRGPVARAPAESRRR